MGLAFVDSGGWIALLKGNDKFHPAAVNYYQAQAGRGTRFLTTNYVVDETATRLIYDAGLDAAMSFRKALKQSVKGRRLRVLWVQPRHEEMGWDLLSANPEVELSLTDAISAAMARQTGISEVFGFDTDFKALGFDLRPDAP
ncbi:MAG: type II toxin-antitoxin system VapC family toxin [Actinomycetota bacterium]